MAKKTYDGYPVALKAPKGHVVPPLLADFGAWLAGQPYKSAGYLRELEAAPFSEGMGWDEHVARISANGYAIGTTLDGSLLVLLDKVPAMPVVCLGGEGEIGTAGDSLEAFLLAWSRGTTDVMDLDDDAGAKGRKALAAWLKERKLKAPKARAFDFEAWLADTAKVAAKKAVGTPAKLADLVGRSPKDAAVEAFLAKHATKGAVLDIELSKSKGKIGTVFLSQPKKRKTPYGGPVPYDIDFGMTRPHIAKAVGRKPDEMTDEWDLWNEGPTVLRAEFDDDGALRLLIVAEPWRDDDE